MALQDGFPSASGVASANDIRLGLAGLVVRDTSGNPRTGIFPRHANALVTSTATMNSAVAGFEACLSRSGQGAIFLPNDGVVNVLHGNAPPANSRYDIVYTKQNDGVAPNADANSLPVFGTFALAASPSPTLPTFASAKVALDAAPGVLPGAEPLAAVLIPSTATTMQSSGVVYTQLFQYTATSGGVVQFRTKEELDLWTTAPPQQRACALATGVDYRFNGTSWRIASRSVIGEYQKGAAPGFVLLTAYSDTTPAVTVTAVTNGGKVEIEYDASVQYAGVGINNMIIYYKVLCDGVVVGDESTQHLPPINAGSVCRLSVSHTPAAGSHVWKIQVASSSVSAAVLGKARLVIIENP